MDEPLNSPPVATVTVSEKTTKTNSTETSPPVRASILPGTIALMLTVGLLAFAALLCFKPIPEANQRLVDTLFGGLLVGCTTAWGYFFTANQASDARSALRITKGTP